MVTKERLRGGCAGRAQGLRTAALRCTNIKFRPNFGLIRARTLLLRATISLIGDMLFKVTLQNID